MPETPQNPTHQNRQALERLVLCALYEYLGDPSFRQEAITGLTHYRFSEFEFQCIFDALCSIPNHDATLFRQHVLERLTRMGFPDLNLTFLLNSPRSTLEESCNALRLLLTH